MVKEGDILVGNEEILGGLKSAISRGETLKDAMMTFYQAGYDKYEIEEAARAYLAQKPLEQTINPAQRLAKFTPVKEEKKEPLKKIPTQEELRNTGPQMPSPLGVPKPKQKELAPQRVSSYEPPKKPSQNSGKGLTILLGIILLVLVGILAAVILFKSELVGFFNSLFG